MATSGRESWTEIGETPYPWEREALDYLRDKLPRYDPYRGRALFEFIAQDGSINEVDALVVGSSRLYLVEIKSWPGVVSGDARDWVNDRGDGRQRVFENPLIIAQRKAQRLKGLLETQPSVKRAKARLPFIQPLVFLSHPDVVCKLAGVARQHICLRDISPEGRERPGIISAITQPHSSRRVDRPALQLVMRALDEAGIRESSRKRQVGDYVLGEPLGEGAGWQDFAASHVSLEERARIRIFGLTRDGNDAERETVRRAARREYALVGPLVTHPGFDAPLGYTDSDLGPALRYRLDPDAEQLDAFIVKNHGRLTLEDRLGLIRQISEALHYAHRHGVVHGALCPSSVEVSEPAGAAAPQIRIRDWQAGFAADGGGSDTRGATSHPGVLLADPAYLYMAPEALSADVPAGPERDVFSVGALAYHIITGTPPAATLNELVERSRNGLSLSSVIDGVPDELELLVGYATTGDLDQRTQSIEQVLAELAAAEKVVHEPEPDRPVDPASASTGDSMGSGIDVIERLGAGATAYALLVERDGVEYVLKVARGPEHDARLGDEAEVLDGLTHSCILRSYGTVAIGDRTGVLLERAGESTLSERLRRSGQLHPDMLERWGGDLLEALAFLESEGVSHRDIKPENLGVRERRGNREEHLVLFDFSLARAPLDAVRAGTTGYIDPFLANRGTWDLHGDRWSAAVTLYQMATAELPIFGDGRSDPAVLDTEATVEESGFDTGVAPALAAFFRQALRRDARERFGSAEEMLRAWRAIFSIAGGGPGRAEQRALDAAVVASRASLDDPLAGLDLPARVVAVFDRFGATTVQGALALPVADVYRAAGASHRSKRDAASFLLALRERFADELQRLAGVPDERLSVDMLVERLVPRRTEPLQERYCEALLGVAPVALTDSEETQTDAWRTLADIASRLELDGQSAAAAIETARNRWQRTPALTALRSDVEAALRGEGGVLTADELVTALLARRGSARSDLERRRNAAAVARAALEAEAGRKDPRFELHRAGQQLLIAVSVDGDGQPIDGLALATYAAALGQRADVLASNDPPLAAARVLDELRSEAPPEGLLPLPDARLVRLASASSTTAAVSGRLELYLRGLASGRALALSRGALIADRLTPEEIRRRVAARFPEAEPTPDRPALDALLADCGTGLEWDPARGFYTIVSGGGSSALTGLAPRRATTLGTRLAPDDPAALEANQFERRLADARARGGFLCLAARVDDLEPAREELHRRFDLHAVSIDREMLNHLRRAADQHGVRWEIVERADTTPQGSIDWSRLQQLVEAAVAGVEEEIGSQEGIVLLTDAGLLARYGRMDVVDRLRDRAGARGSPLTGLWLLVPGDPGSELPLLDGAAIPVIGRGQWAWVPGSWIENAHRAAPGEDAP